MSIKAFHRTGSRGQNGATITARPAKTGSKLTLTDDQEDKVLSMQQELHSLKQALVEKDLNVKHLTAQVQRTEEAAKRALVMQHQPDEHGNLMPKAQTKRLLTARRILELEQEVSRLSSDNRDLLNKSTRLHTELKGQKNKALEAKNRLDVALKDVRRLNRRIGELEQQAKLRGTGSMLAMSQRGTREGSHEVEALRQEVAELTVELSDTKEQLQNVYNSQDHELQQVKQALDAANDQLEAFHSHGAQAQSMPADPYSTWALLDWLDEDNGITRLHDPETQLLFSQAGAFSDWPAVIGRLDGSGRAVPANILVQALHVLNGALKNGQLGRVLHSGSGSAGAPVNYDAGVALLQQAVSIPPSGLGTAAESQAASVDLMWCFGFSEHHQMDLSEFERLVKAGLQLFESYSQGRLRVHSRELHASFLEQAKGRREELRAMLDRDAQSRSARLDWKDAFTLLQQEIAVQDEAAQLLKIMLLHWCSRDGSYIPIANIFKLLRLVTIRRGMPSPGVEQSMPGSPDVSRTVSSLSQGTITSAQVTLERQLKAIKNLASDLVFSQGSFDYAVEQREQDSDLRLLQTATGDRNHIISRILQRSARCFQQYKDAHANLEVLKEKHKELGDLFHVSHEKVSQLMKQLTDLKGKAATVPKLQAEFTSLQESLRRAEQRLSEAQAQNTEARTAKTSEARNLLTQLQDRDASLREAQEAELQARKKYQELINAGVPSQDDYKNLEQKLSEEVTAKKKVEAELEQAQNKLTLLQHMGPQIGPPSSSMGAGNWSILPEHDMRGYSHHARGLFGDVGGDSASNGDVDAILSELTKYQRLYGQVSEENKRLRVENGGLLQGLNKEMQALQLENSRLQAQLERAERDLATARLAACEAAQLVAAASEPGTKAAAEDELGDLNPDENILELQIVMAELTVGPAVTTFFTLDFFDHATQVSTQQLGPNPKYSSTVQFVVPMSEAFFRYMATSTLKLELNQLLSADWAQIGRATLQLSEVLQACQQGSAPDQHVRNLRIHGPGGTSLGTVRVQYRMPRPIPSVAQLQQDVDRELSVMQADPLFRFAQHAKRHPASAAGLQVTIVSCAALRVVGADSARPYVNYQFPGHPQPVDTAIQPGAAPVFEEKRTFEFAPDPQTSCLFLSKLGEERLQLHVFDAGNAGEHVGSASVPLRPLTEESTRHIRNTFDLRRPGKDEIMGKITIAVEWVRLLADVSATAAHLEVGTSALCEPEADTASLQEGEAVLEWHLGNINIKPALLLPHDKVYASFKFLEFPECISKAITGASGDLDYTLRSKAVVNQGLVAQMASHDMEIQVHKQQAFHHTLLGSAHVGLADVLACFTSANGPPQFFQNVPVYAAGNSSSVIAHVEAAARSHGYKRWSDWGAGQAVRDNASNEPATTEPSARATPIVQKVLMDPEAWPSNSRKHIVLVLHTLVLRPFMLRQQHKTIQVFWNLLDSEVNAHSEATGELAADKTSIELGQAMIYNVSAGDATKQGARSVLLQKLKAQDSQGSLCFGLVARSSEGDYVAITAEVSLHDLRLSGEDKWREVKLPMYSMAEDRHVADVIVTIRAQAALSDVWTGHQKASA